MEGIDTKARKSAPRLLLPRSTLSGATLRTGRIAATTPGVFFLVPILYPFIAVVCHVVQSGQIGRVLAQRGSSAVILLGIVRDTATIIDTACIGCEQNHLPSRSRRVLPLRLG